ncbi:MAG: transketolase C-terminal domain-containing protein [Candidatus Limnocylindrales bacterium]
MAEELIDPRDTLIAELIDLAAVEPRLVVLDADVSRTTHTRQFRDRFPARFYDVGIAEQNLLGISAGMATMGCIPVASTFSVFASMRAAEQLRTSICYPRLNVKVLGGYAAMSDAKDGATHHSIEDVAITRSLANLVVLAPSDGVMARKVARAAVEHVGPVYVRVEYGSMPVLHEPATSFRIGQGYRMRAGSDITIAAYGSAVARALQAAAALARDGIDAEVLDMVSLKPIDEDLLLDSVGRTGALVTLEDHNVIGGLASAACQALVGAGMAPRFRALGIGDTFTESGAPDDLRDKYGVASRAAVAAALELCGRADAGPRV